MNIRILWLPIVFVFNEVEYIDLVLGADESSDDAYSTLLDKHSWPQNNRDFSIS